MRRQDNLSGCVPRWLLPPTHTGLAVSPEDRADVSEPPLTLCQHLERAVEVLRESRVKVISHVRRVDVDVSRRVHDNQPEVSTARKAPNCARIAAISRKGQGDGTGMTVDNYIFANQTDAVMSNQPQMLEGNNLKSLRYFGASTKQPAEVLRQFNLIALRKSRRIRNRSAVCKYTLAVVASPPVTLTVQIEHAR